MLEGEGAKLGKVLNLEPADWIWIPGERTLNLTFALFRAEVSLTASELASKDFKATGHILADSRYLLWVNGIAVQWGPAPFDPRFPEADPCEFAKHLRPGKNVIGVHVLYFGHGDGTWPTGKPGLLGKFQIGNETLVTGKDRWLCTIDRGHRPGSFKRSYLRALQEQFDSRKFPHGWNEPDYQPTSDWVAPRIVVENANRAPISGWHSAYDQDIYMPRPDETQVFERQIPLMKEIEVAAARAVDFGLVDWQRDPDDWFENRMPNSFRVSSLGNPPKTPVLLNDFKPNQGKYVTYEWDYQRVGFPKLEIEAPAGTIVELMTHESVNPDQPWLDNHFYSWSRYICKGGRETFVNFDYDSFKFVQVHVRPPENAIVGAQVVVHRVSNLVREYAFPHEPDCRVNDPEIQRVLDAGHRTILNSCLETAVDCVGRERQQYGGDGGHQLHLVRMGRGDHLLPERYLTQFGYGQMLNGVWFDSWPAFDRYARLSQRQLGLSGWGSLLDHSVGFLFDHFHHYEQWGHAEPILAHLSQFARFLNYLRRQRDSFGLVKVEDVESEAVWIDHDAFREQRHKQAAFNFYILHLVATMQKHQRLWESHPAAAEVRESLVDLQGSLAGALRRRFWNAEAKRWDNALPCGGVPSIDDRSLSHIVLLEDLGYALSPDADEDQTLKKAAREQLIALALTDPAETNKRDRKEGFLGFSYPANAVWRFWAYGAMRRNDLTLNELKIRWANLFSVLHNGTLQEMWNAEPGTTAQMSHCPVGPNIAMHRCLLGLRMFNGRDGDLRPDLAGLQKFEITSYIPAGAIHFKHSVLSDRTRWEILPPLDARLELILPTGERKSLKAGMPNIFEF